MQTRYFILTKEMNKPKLTIIIIIIICIIINEL